MHSIVGTALTIGLFFIWSANKEELRKPAGFLALGLAIAIIVPELIYLPQIGNPPLFWLDFIEETVIALLIVIALFHKEKGVERK